MKNIALKLGFSTLIFLLLVFGLEAALAIAGYGKLVRYSPDEDLYWKPIPNQTVYTKVGKQPVRINSHGTRGAAFDAAKPADTFRIICLGDSRTFGWGMAEDETFPKRLETQLRSRLPSGRRVEVINAGVNAWSYPQMLKYLEVQGLAYSPDLVILDGANLWVSFTEDQSEAFKRSFLRKVRIKNMLRRSAIYHYLVEVRMQKFYEKHREKAVPTEERPDEKEFDELEKKMLRDLEETMAAMADLLRRNNAELVLLHIPREDEPVSRRNKYMKAIKTRVTEQKSCAFVDLAAAFEASAGHLFLEADPIHPNAEGNAIVADGLFEAVSGLERYRDFVTTDTERAVSY